MNIGFQALPTATESRDSVLSVVGRPTCGRPVVAVRRRRPCLSAPTSALGCHDATPSASQPHFLPSALSPLRFFLGELHSESAASPELSSPSLAKPASQSSARASSTSAPPPLPLSSAGKAALPSPEPFFLAGVPPGLTGDVVRPHCSTIPSLFCS